MNPPDSGAANSVAQALLGSLLVIFIIGLAITIFIIFVYWRIVSKAGYNGALSLLALVPIVNIVMLCIFAFSEWPIQKELNQLRQQLAMSGQQPYPPSGQYPQYPQMPQQPQQYSQNSPQ
jgi:amino acid transporter